LTVIGGGSGADVATFGVENDHQAAPASELDDALEHRPAGRSESLEEGDLGLDRGRDVGDDLDDLRAQAFHRTGDDVALQAGGVVEQWWRKKLQVRVESDDDGTLAGLDDADQSITEERRFRVVVHPESDRLHVRTRLYTRR
jgi:hypothetical protein